MLDDDNDDVNFHPLHCRNGNGYNHPWCVAESMTLAVEEASPLPVDVTMVVPFWLQHCGRVGQKQPGGFAPVGAVWGLSALSSAVK